MRADRLCNFAGEKLQKGGGQVQPDINPCLSKITADEATPQRGLFSLLHVPLLAAVSLPDMALAPMTQAADLSGEADPRHQAGAGSPRADRRACRISSPPRGGH